MVEAMNDRTEAEAVRLATYDAWSDALRRVDVRAQLWDAVYSATTDWLNAHPDALKGPR